MAGGAGDRGQGRDISKDSYGCRAVGSTLKKVSHRGRLNKQAQQQGKAQAHSRHGVQPAVMVTVYCQLDKLYNRLGDGLWHGCWGLYGTVGKSHAL